MNKLNALSQIKSFLEGYNQDLKYLVNVETDVNNNFAECIVHPPDEPQKIVKIKYTPFIYMKDLTKQKYNLYDGRSEQYKESMKIKYGIEITKLKTGNQKRLVDGYCYKITSTKSYNYITKYLIDGGLNPYEKLKDDDGNLIRNEKGEIIYPYRDLFYDPGTNEQFFISNKCRLFNGFEEYKNVHRLIFDIETTGLRHQLARVFAIGVWDNKGFERILEVDKREDDESEIRLIQDFFNLINHIRPAVIAGFHSEGFDFEFILGRAAILKMDLTKIPTGLKEGKTLVRKPNTSVKYGNTADKYTATKMWGYSVIDILHAAKRTQAINSDIKEVKLKYLAKFEKVAKPNRTYVAGDDNGIGKFYHENKVFLINDINEYVQLPDKFQETGKNLYKLQANKHKVTEEQYKTLRTKYLKGGVGFLTWFNSEAKPKNMNTFIGGRKIVKQYLLDDLWETAQIDELYNQSSFMLAKIVPTTFQRVCTMGTAAIWNLLLTAWSYENDLAIPISDTRESFSGGLARCYKAGYSKRIIKIDYASLYPMIQLSEGVFPMFDITGVLEKMLLYLTTTRNIYKKLANNAKLNNEELTLLKQVDHEVHEKYLNNSFTSADISMFKVKQLPIKILNNSLFGALGSAVSFNWSDNICASRITCTGRLYLRRAVDWFSNYGCVALLAVTDGINFAFPEKTTIRVNGNNVEYNCPEDVIETMWQYGDKTGISALIEKYNTEEMKSSYMSVDDDGISISCLNLSRINYGTMSLAKDKKTGEMKEKIKLTGNTIKSKVMPEYIEEFIDKGLTMILHGQGKEFVDYYYDYCDDIRYMQIPLKKIATKNKIKKTIDSYNKRGQDKNGKEKGKQAYMELLIEKRNNTVEELFQKHKDTLELPKKEDKLKITDKLKLVANYMPQEPELDSIIYIINTGTERSQLDSGRMIDPKTGKERICASIIPASDLLENPNMLGEYNYKKYFVAFNKRVAALIVAFDPEVQKKILVKIDKQGNLKKEMFTSEQLQLKNYDLDDYDQSMYLEDLEVNFWNKTGYNPRLIWDGFKMHGEHKVHFEIYENALNFLNEKMVASKRPLIKSINDKYVDGDFVLIKNGKDYSVGLYNGTFIEIKRENVQIPKSEIELEMDRRAELEAEKIKELEITLKTKNDKELFLEAQYNKRLKYFGDFKREFKLSEEMDFNKFIDELGGASMLDEYIQYQESDKKMNDNDENDY